MDKRPELQRQPAPEEKAEPHSLPARDLFQAEPPRLFTKPALRRLVRLLFPLFALLLLTGCGAEAAETGGAFALPLPDTSDPAVVGNGVQMLLLLTVLSLAPAVLIMVTAFTRIVIVLSFVRNALAVPQVPPNQVLIGLALFLTFFVMAPTWQEVNTQALQPFLAGTISQDDAVAAGSEPVREFLFKQTRENDLALFIHMAQLPRPQTRADVPTYVLVPAFVISELKTAFQMGFILFVPFLIIDMVVASVLMSMGMMMLPPPVISLPFKILLFVMVDGWHLIARSLLMSFGTM